MKKRKMSLDAWDDVPKDMVKYLRHNGWHFNKKACEYATGMMISDETGDKLQAWTRQQVDDLLDKHGVKIEDTNNYDYVYVANMAKADYFHSAIPDEMHLATFVKKTIEDKDASEGQTFRRWYSDMVGAGEMIFWEDLL